MSDTPVGSPSSLFTLDGIRAFVASRWPECCVALIVLCSSLAFFLVWRFAYQGDHVMCGLMAKSILTRGERPLFLWTLGYNGILVEAYAVAAMFWVFGVHVYSYYLFTLLCFFGLCALYAKQVATHAGRAQGLLALTAFAVGSPDMYRYIMRPQPNYTEICILGLCLMWQVRTLISDLYVQGLPFSRKHFALFCSTGFTLGFALYTYQLIVFFIGSTAMWLGALYLRDALGADLPRQMATESTPSDGQEASVWLRLALQIASGLAVVGSGQYFLGAAGEEEKRLFLSMMKTSAAIAGVSVTVDVLLRRQKVVRTLLGPALAACACAALGYAPALVFKYVQQGHSRNRLVLNLDHAHMKNALSLFLQAHWRFLNAYGPVWKNVIGYAELCLMATFVVQTFAALFCFIRGTHPKEALLKINPLAFLPFVVLPLFCVNNAAVALESAKWTTCLWLFYALSQSSVLLSFGRRGGARAKVAIAVAAVLFANNTHALASALQSQEAKEFTGEKLIAQLQKRNITRAYSEYWYAYSINFYTNERIIVEPVFNNYCPHYAAVVARAPRIAFIDPEVERLRQAPEQVLINNVPYKKTDAWFDTDVGFLVLEKMAPEPTPIAAP